MMMVSGIRSLPGSRKRYLLLKELVLTTVLWGVLLYLITVWFSGARLVFTVSMAAGILGAAAMAAHIYRSIEYAMEMSEISAVKYLKKQSILRMGIMIVLLLLAYYLKGSVIAVFLGLLALKPGAYTQPLLHKIRKGR